MKSHRGTPVPEIFKEDGWFYIVDQDHGWIFQAYTKKDVLEQWTRRLDTALINAMVADGKIDRRTDDTYGCLTCASIIFDPFLHQETHVV